MKHEERKIKAIELLNKLDIYKPYIKGFEEKDQVCFFERFGGYWVEQEPEIYNKMNPKKEVHTMGSMRNNTSAEGTVKDFYTRDEALKFTKKDFDNNPALYKAVEQSMLKW